MALLAKTIAITGAASGIGRMTTICLAGQGANLSIADLDLDKLQEVAAEVMRQHPDCAVICTALDVRHEHEVDEWIRQTVQRFGLLDGAVNLAGVLRQGLVSNFALDDWRLVLDVNLTGVFVCTKAQVRSMNDGGSIVNASSRAGLHGTANYAAYCASKHGVIGLTKAVAQEVGAKGIRANCICPGVIDTPMTAAFEGVPADQIIQRKGRPDEIASLIAYLLGDQSRFITASAITIDGGLP
ncbi:hypothetical protein Z517_08792 [Fonsecaea pedrosoi CBS 271.37]|uniref:Ketoreductase domain-containing protein n=1 Tax=Fonsecaea pedrosoi CBS 271.37 TaxID=1442368 RepID=A0A0D2EXN2_9EURO|nr:uncharacterized protein Z517_08792 [Fonsecaea pedrosoi CBS 271.37]KIW78952.1 hypothetical protein Z517_08792 [Fonsecaea pedrosoi CBS 271.37]